MIPRSMFNRLLTNFVGVALLSLFAVPLQAGEHLPQSVTFKGQSTFDALVAKAIKEDWRSLPMGQRVAAFGLAMRGIKYKGFTLEIDDHVESPSANLEAVD